MNNCNRREQHLFECGRSQDLNMYLLVLDVNRFKKINDEHGHVQGDLAIKGHCELFKRILY
ncbi:MAG: diguanylate cyclase domain-containing protein [Holdemanella porci]